MQETVIFSGTIVGERQQVSCKVRATKTTLDTGPPDRSETSANGYQAHCQFLRRDIPANLCPSHILQGPHPPQHITDDNFRGSNSRQD
jgi:hypothetical protein